jgi:nicotinic acid phosphoribosyltransferase
VSSIWRGKVSGWGAGTKLSRLKPVTPVRKIEFTGFRERVQEAKNTVKKIKRAARPGKKAGKRAKKERDPVSG